MKLYTFVNSDWSLIEKKFVNSIKDDYEIIIKKAYFKKSIGIHCQEMWEFRTKMILEAIKDNYNDKIIVTDIDIQFFRPTQPLIDYSPDVDFLCQWEHGDICCIGFMVINCNDRTLEFFRDVLLRVCNGEWEQKVINEKLRKENNIRWSFLPKEIWGFHPDHPIPPNNVVCHHATFALTLDDKLKQMNEIDLKINDFYRPIKIPISLIMVVRNEAKRLQLLLPKYAKVFDEIVVVDQNSEDNSTKICQEYNVKIIKDANWGFSEMSKNLASFSAKNEWCLSIDADEEISPEFLLQLNNLDLNFDCYYIIRNNGLSYINDKDAYEEQKLRLFRKGYVYCHPCLHADYEPSQYAKIGRIPTLALWHHKTDKENKLDFKRYNSIINRYKGLPIITQSLIDRMEL